MTDANDAMPAVQTIRNAAGEPEFAALPHAQFEILWTQARRATGIEAAADAITFEINRLALIPSEVVHRISKGEHPVRVWRLHRKMKAVELARAAGISPGYLSEIETGKKDGTFRTMAQIAQTLGVRLDDLMPVIDEIEVEEHRREVQLRDIARQISEIESMINGNAGFDSGAVRQGAVKLKREARDFMANRSGKFDWLEGVVTRAEKIIDEIGKVETTIVEAVTDSQKRLSSVFSDQLARSGLFPQGMIPPEKTEKPSDLPDSPPKAEAEAQSQPEPKSEPVNGEGPPAEAETAQEEQEAQEAKTPAQENDAVEGDPTATQKSEAKPSWFTR
ncbi:MAG: helix-turn-helix domain-containing protein [Alphaproteobacteria bacterium]